MASNGKNRGSQVKALEQMLLLQQQELSKRLQSRLGEVFVDDEPDDEAAHATYSVARDMSAANIERERKTLAEVEEALKRIAKGEYGVCESCEEPISEARLKALPWARLCIDCASQLTQSPANQFGLRAAIARAH